MDPEAGQDEPGRPQRQVWFFAPSLKRYESELLKQSCGCFFMPVSITGEQCALMCDHCRAEILSYMRPALSPRELLSVAAEYKRQGAKGLLVSGGSDGNGSVPLGGFTDALARIKHDMGLRVLVHTGLVDGKLADGLAAAGIDAAMIDIVGADETISQVCHLPEATVSDYEASLANLAAAGVPAAPHIVIGLHNGHKLGEGAALEIVSRHKIASLVLVGLTPLRGTPMESVEPPTPEEMGVIFRKARRLLPETPILLGCERPGGEHKEKTDMLALEAGLDGIAYPAEGVIQAAVDMGLQAHTSEMCCSLLFLDPGRRIS